MLLNASTELLSSKCLTDQVTEFSGTWKLIQMQYASDLPPQVPELLLDIRTAVLLLLSESYPCSVLFLATCCDTGPQLHPCPWAYCAYRGCTTEWWCRADFQCYLTWRQVKLARSSRTSLTLFIKADVSLWSSGRKPQYSQVIETSGALRSPSHLKHNKQH